MDYANDPGVCLWKLYTLQGKYDRYNISGFQNLFYGRWLIKIEKMKLRSWTVKWIRTNQKGDQTGDQKFVLKVSGYWWVPCAVLHNLF